MSKVQLYQGIIDATKTIVAKFGKDVVKEERFVYILADMYPDRDNLALFIIIKSMIKDGIMSEINSSIIDNISSVIAKSSLTLSQKYGYDKRIVDGILYSVAIGCGIITYSDYNALFDNSNQNQSQQQNIPNQKHNNPSHGKQPQKKQKQQPARHRITIKYFLLLIFGYIVLLFSPAIYLGLTCNSEWLPFFAFITIAFFHFLTIVMFGQEITDDYKNRPMPLVGGLYLGLTVCAILFWILCPIVLGFDFIDLKRILDYYGFGVKTQTPEFISILLCYFCALCCFIFVPGAIEFSGIKIPTNTKNLDKYKIIFENMSFRKGFMFTCIFFIIFGIIGLLLPLFGEMRLNNKIDRFNEKVERINTMNIQIKKERSASYQVLSFGIFKLGSNLDSCINVVESTLDYRILNKTEIPLYIRDYKIEIAGCNYTSIIDTTLYVSTIWDNNATDVCLSFLGKKLVGITFVTDINCDSLISIYSKKYGNPEYELKKQIRGDYSYHNVDIRLDYKLLPNEYSWTFANGIIKINVSRNFIENGMLISSMDFDGNVVTYFDRRCEKVLQELNAEKKRKEEVKERRIKDSLNRLEIAKQKQLEEERLRQEKNHNESMENI